MKIIKEGKPYRIHKCRKCKTKYSYQYYFTGMGYIHCPKCNYFLDKHTFDKKISKKQYESIKEGNNE